MTFRDILAKYRAISFSERDKGDRFERLMLGWLLTDPAWEPRIDRIWLWHDFPCRKEFGGKDVGIDLVARTHNGEYWAIQCKCYDEDTTISKPHIDTFLSTSGKKFMNANGETVNFQKRIWISTNKWGREAENAIDSQTPEVVKIKLHDLVNSPVNWEALENGIHGEKARNAKKTPRQHQKDAIDAFHEYFKEGNERGKLIMACASGKTYTSLKIAENETGSKGFILFLAPSIALIGQTLREWTAEAEKPIFPVCVCSDPTITRARAKEEDSDLTRVIDLAYPASTSVDSLVAQLKKAESSDNTGMTVIFSTYQSIDVVANAQKAYGKEFDLVICDEAHRTTGVTLKGNDESSFVRVHDNKFISARHRIYMTATPRLYHADTKEKAKNREAALCSMDDEKLYGQEVYKLGFGQAVDMGLLTDYKVLVLTVTQADLKKNLQIAIGNKNCQIDTENAAKLVGCIKALSKETRYNRQLLRLTDPKPMLKAMAFCQTIKKSELLANVFSGFCDQYLDSLEPGKREKLVRIESKHVDGTMSADTRNSLLAWLNDAKPEENVCHILHNVRCLSEGVDVPSLDAVIFLSPRDSEIEVIQSVGRVMRAAPGKKFGYIIVPVLIPAGYRTDSYVSRDDRFRVVWKVLAALRAHDDRFEPMIKRMELNKKPPERIIIDSVDDDDGGPGKKKKDGKDGGDGREHVIVPFTAQEFHELEGNIYARLVMKVGDRMYWEQWAARVAKIAQRYTERINMLISQSGRHQDAFNKFLVEIRQNINPAVQAPDVVEMLSQHYITRPVFDALFENSVFVKLNPVSQALQGMIDLLEEQAFEKDTISLSRFYDSVKLSVSKMDNAQARQKIMVELYDKFFRVAFPLMVQKLGIVYTPIQIVDFINQSVADILARDFGRSISDKDVNILDPFTGTGTFIVRLIESGLIAKDSLPRKYAYELFANEIVLLAYYVASINIENAYHNAMGGDAPYMPFRGICLTDTFQLAEKKWYESDANFMKKNSHRVRKEINAKIQVIIGNPPYSVGQRSANDNAQNQKYANLEERIADTYAAGTSATNKNSLYDSYIKAFRWASDRIDRQNGGIIAFVSNAGWLDGNAMDGMRKCFVNEFSDIYVFNLRGNQRTSGETSRREGGKIFGSGSRTPVAIAILVKKPDHTGDAVIHYHDIGDYLSREDKLKIIAQKASVLSENMAWEILESDARGEWLNHGNNAFEQMIPLGNKKDRQNKHTVFAPYFSNGVKTQRDVWCCNFSKPDLIKNIETTIEHFNSHLDDAHPDIAENKISWSRSFQYDFEKKRKKSFDEKAVCRCVYRPFCKMNMYFSSQMNEMTYQMPKLFPTGEAENLLICVYSYKSAMPIVANVIPDLHFNGDTQCFPLYYYEPASLSQPTLFDAAKKPQYARKNAITSFILERCQEIYGRRVTRENIFYYVYGILHSPDYRNTFAADLKKSLPRLPLVEKPADFWAFSKAGRDLAELHLNYETQPHNPDVIVTGTGNNDFHVTKMKFPDKKDKTVIRYNDKITISHIPLAAYEYVVNGRSAIEWIMERYQIKTDKASGIVNDPNDWAKEHGKPRYILDLLLSIVTVSLETMKIMEGLPKLEYPVATGEIRLS